MELSYVLIDGVLKETEAAILIDVDGDEIWIPKSQIHEDSQVRELGDRGELVIPEWLAIEKGLE